MPDLAPFRILAFLDVLVDRQQAVVIGGLVRLFGTFTHEQHPCNEYGMWWTGSGVRRPANRLYTRTPAP
ncbi:hypothetical protein D3C85_1613840 [compost metagenome]